MWWSKGAKIVYIVKELGRFFSWGPEFFCEGKGLANFFGMPAEGVAKFFPCPQREGQSFFSHALKGGAEEIDNCRSWIKGHLSHKK